jgi:L,D-peptidoglycan transpeptidase YkuD (ErfK/YbiS/YcfS/YnhG family)
MNPTKTKRKRKRIIPLVLCAISAICGSLASAAPLPASCLQLVVGLTDSWDSSTGTLQLYQRLSPTAPWTAVSTERRILLGKNGIAWGRGVAGQEQPGLRKKEGDQRAPAGLFRIGTIYTFDDSLPAGADYPFHTITTADAWIDDVTHPLYNQHVTVDPANPPAWFEKQAMRHNDPPHRWLVEIRHNADPTVPGAGSAIFFHLQRGPDRKTAGCTTMAEDTLVPLIRWLRADADPHYVLLPRNEYAKLSPAWNLPQL